MPTPTQIPILLLKTRTTPTDTYETHFSRSSSPFTPTFIPVLEHKPNEQNLARIRTLLRERRLTEEYGGVIFTSQRAVEGFARVVGEVDEEEKKQEEVRRGKIQIRTESGNPSSPTTQQPPPAPAAYALNAPFPLYVVGPATEHTLATLLQRSRTLSSLHCLILGASTGNGETLARFILKHYNHLHYHAYFSLYEAPRLPFVPLVGNRSEQYPRLESGDRRLRKKGLLFLVGETRRDVIPRLLGSETELSEGERVAVEEVEVYRTGVMGEFEEEFREKVERLVEEGHERVVVVVFSPSGCEAMLKVIGWRGVGAGEDSATIEWHRGRFVVATIGPTTRDYLKEKFGFEADVTAKTPSPEGIWEGVLNFLKERGEVAAL